MQLHPHFAGVHIVSYTHGMILITRSATIQVRVVPVIKRASEEVLGRIGLTMSEAVDLFLRRVIVDQRIPFDLIALEEEQIATLPEHSLAGERGITAERTDVRLDRSVTAPSIRARRKKSKKFFGARTPTGIEAAKARKKSA